MSMIRCFYHNAEIFLFRKFPGTPHIPFQSWSLVCFMCEQNRRSRGFPCKQEIPTVTVNYSGNLENTLKCTVTRGRQNPQSVSKFLNDRPIACIDVDENSILLNVTSINVIRRFGRSVIPSRTTYQSTRRDIPNTFVLK
jgi:hypothetical protein